MAHHGTKEWAETRQPPSSLLRLVDKNRACTHKRESKWKRMKDERLKTNKDRQVRLSLRLCVRCLTNFSYSRDLSPSLFPLLVLLLSFLLSSSTRHLSPFPSSSSPPSSSSSFVSSVPGPSASNLPRQDGGDCAAHESRAGKRRERGDPRRSHLVKQPAGEDVRERVTVSESETQEIPNSRGASGVLGCAFSRYPQVKNVTRRTYTAEDSGKFVPVVAFECRGVEPVKWYPADGYVVKSKKATFRDVELSEDWVDYDQDANLSVGIYNVEWEFQVLR
ncbi:c1orf123, related [Neospora caninum Liverpool]|uniref:C1orf123, related n=1 Tax=Neospora caninum (strain Liverpool) TaxID=572307 RepID=F0VBS1_NEOCL|nr:c1orf123, related [Neospora caninum Liverpool]CBZ51055.1 c1orf123, related [Neospora caninum Liverpool]|eukprot:XP_003881088.1 c1orf123, related [Neospora caninum Liverpool]